jgi:hypothetical protein
MAGGSISADAMGVVNACSALSHWAIMDFAESYAADSTDAIEDALATLVAALAPLIGAEATLVVVLDKSVELLGDEVVSGIAGEYVLPEDDDGDGDGDGDDGDGDE